MTAAIEVEVDKAGEFVKGSKDGHLWAEFVSVVQYEALYLRDSFNERSINVGALFDRHIAQSGQLLEGFLDCLLTNFAAVL